MSPRKIITWTYKLTIFILFIDRVLLYNYSTERYVINFSQQSIYGSDLAFT